MTESETETVYPAGRPRRRMTHPGQLLQQILIENNIPQNVAARRLALPVHQVKQLCAGRSPITPNIATRVQNTFGINARLWMNLQQDHDRTLGYAPRPYPKVSPLAEIVMRREDRRYRETYSRDGLEFSEC